MKRLDIAGQRFGNWVVRKRANKATYWTCVCDCGTVKDVFLGSLRAGRSKRCPACHSRWMSESGQARANATKHGMHKSSEYRSWKMMKERCYRESNHNFRHYGGRGITVCDRWKNDFQAFFDDMGKKPKGHTLDRIDVNGDYEPSNCRWATVVEQNWNKKTSRNIVVDIDGERLTLIDSLTKFGNVVSYPTAVGRIRRGWDHKRAVSEPARKYTIRDD